MLIMEMVCLSLSILKPQRFIAYKSISVPNA